MEQSSGTSYLLNPVTTRISFTCYLRSLTRITSNDRVPLDPGTVSDIVKEEPSVKKQNPMDYGNMGVNLHVTVVL